jgi:hypothetical protein
MNTVKMFHPSYAGEANVPADAVKVWEVEGWQVAKDSKEAKE